MTIRERYSDKYVRMRAYCHLMLHGLICAFALGFSDFGWFALFGPWGAEIYQFATDKAYDIEDGVYDLSEGLLGGLVIGGLFFVQKIYFC